VVVFLVVGALALGTGNAWMTLPALAVILGHAFARAQVLPEGWKGAWE